MGKERLYTFEEMVKLKIDNRNYDCEWVHTEGGLMMKAKPKPTKNSGLINMKKDSKRTNAKGESFEDFMKSVVEASDGKLEFVKNGDNFTVRPIDNKQKKEKMAKKNSIKNRAVETPSIGKVFTEQEKNRLLKYVGNMPETTRENEDLNMDNISNIETDEEGKLTQLEMNISIVEFAVYNSFLFSARKKKFDGIRVESYGQVNNIGLINYGGGFKPTQAWWFKLTKTKEVKINITVQTTKAKNSQGEIYCSLNIVVENGVTAEELANLYNTFKSIAFNNSEYKGKCLKIAVRDGSFDSIEIIPVEDSGKDLILTDIQKRYMEHFRVIVGRGGNARYLFNGLPGTGKTEIIRKLIALLTPEVTFVIPVFHNTRDLTTIMEACEIFSPGVVVFDDIDLYLGNRDKGSFTSLLGEFLSFFDGVKKRNISLLASTNDKGLVDKAGQRPGRFNAIIDFGYLEKDQVDNVINTHLDEKWRVPEVYIMLKGTIKGKKANVTGAFISNLAENIHEMALDNNDWTLKDTLTLIEDSYIGFYNSQISQQTDTVGFKIKN